eukprot:3113114-Pleurochrysis_carterae.AAC.3
MPLRQACVFWASRSTVQALAIKLLHLLSAQPSCSEQRRVSVASVEFQPVWAILAEVCQPRYGYQRCRLSVIHLGFLFLT